VTTTFDRLSRRMEREAQLSLFDTPPPPPGSASIDGDFVLDHHLRDLDAIERANGGCWRLSETLLPGEVSIRDPRLA